MDIEVNCDSSGMGKVWRVFHVIDGTRWLVWSHAAIEGPVPDALDLWKVLEEEQKWLEVEAQGRRLVDWLSGRY